MIAAIRIRGTVNVSDQLSYTLTNMKLHKPNHLVLVKEDKSSKKMVEKVKDYVAFGEITEEILAKLLVKRGRLEGNERLTIEYLTQNKLGTFEELAKNIIDGKIVLKNTGIKPVFRLHPPRKGHKRGGTKKPFNLGGALGYRGEEINKLITSMS